MGDLIVDKALRIVHRSTFVSSIAAAGLLWNPLIQHRVSDHDISAQEGIPLLRRTERPLQQISPILHQPFNWIVLRPQREIRHLRARIFQEFVAHLKDVAVDVIHTAKHDL